MYCTVCRLLRTALILHYAVLHALVLRQEFVVVSIAGTGSVAGVITDTAAFEICVVVPIIILSAIGGHVWCIRYTDLLY